MNDWPIVALNIFGRGSSVGALCLCYIYSAEIFPTVIRNVGVGSSSLWVGLTIYHRRQPHVENDVDTHDHPQLSVFFSLKIVVILLLL